MAVIFNMYTHHIPNINVLRFAADKQYKSNTIYDKLSIIMISITVIFNKYTHATFQAECLSAIYMLCFAADKPCTHSSLRHKRLPSPRGLLALLAVIKYSNHDTGNLAGGGELYVLCLATIPLPPD